MGITLNKGGEKQGSTDTQEEEEGNSIDKKGT